MRRRHEDAFSPGRPGLLRGAGLRSRPVPEEAAGGPSPRVLPLPGSADPHAPPLAPHHRRGDPGRGGAGPGHPGREAGRARAAEAVPALRPLAPLGAPRDELVRPRGQRQPAHRPLPALRPRRLRGEALHPASRRPRGALRRPHLPRARLRPPRLPGAAALRDRLPAPVVARPAGEAAHAHRAGRHARGPRGARERLPGGSRGPRPGVRPEGGRRRAHLPPGDLVPNADGGDAARGEP